MTNTISQAKKPSAGPHGKRPLSPHLQIYRWQLTMTMSILHRISGAALAVGLFAFTWMLVAAALGPEAWTQFTDVANSWIGRAALIGWTAAFWYHLFNGLRHLLWDTGHALDIPNAYRAGYAVWAATLLMTAVSWWFMFGGEG